MALGTVCFRGGQQLSVIALAFGDYSHIDINYLLVAPPVFPIGLAPGFVPYAHQRGKRYQESPIYERLVKLCRQKILAKKERSSQISRNAHYEALSKEIFI